MRRSYRACIIIFVLILACSIHAQTGGDGSTPAKARVFKTKDASDVELTRIIKDSPKDANRMVSSERDEKRGLVIERIDVTTDGKTQSTYLAYPIDTNDYLKRGWWDNKETPDYEARYKKNVEKILARGFRDDVMLRTIHLPPFDPEWIVGVVRSGDQYRAFRLDASDFIWHAQEDEKEKLPTIHGVFNEKPIANQTARRLIALWRSFVKNPKNYGKESGVIYGDSSHFIFSVDRMTANTFAWEKGTDAAEVVNVSDVIYEFVAGKKSEAELEQSIEKDEKKLSLK
jgi:hypothetical protein